MSPVFDLYRRWVSPLLHSASGVSGACRFQPTCSEYAVLAMSHHGTFYGAALALWRLLRCNPFVRGGFDPVPGTYPVAPHRPPAEFCEFPELDAPFLKRKAHTRSCPELATGNSGLRTDDPRHLP